MSDIASELRERVSAAKEHDRQAHARQLAPRIEQRLLEAHQGCSDGVTYTWAPGSGPGAHWMAESRPGTHHLDWHATEPPRSLWVQVDEARGLILWAWAQDHAPKGGWHEVDALDFDLDSLDRLILGLGEQEVWGRGETPSVRLSRTHA